MKKKVVLFASVVLAAMTMTTSAFAAEILGDVNNSGNLDAQDAAWILEQALSKDYAKTNTSFNLALANVDEDKNVEPKNEITANDAALAYQLAVNEETLKLAVYTQRYGEIVIADLDKEFDGFDTSVRDLVEGKIEQLGSVIDNGKHAERIAKLREQGLNALNKVKFTVSTSSGDKTVKITDQEGWDILGLSVNSLLVDPIYDDAATDKNSNGVFENKELGDIVKVTDGAGKAASDKVDAVSLVGYDAASKTNKELYLRARDAYEVAFGPIGSKGQGVVKTAPSAADVTEAKDRVVNIAKTKSRFGGELQLIYDDQVKKTFTLNKSQDDSAELINAFDGKDYNTITVHDVYEVYANLAGVTVDEPNANGEYGRIQANTANGDRDIDLILVKSK